MKITFENIGRDIILMIIEGIIIGLGFFYLYQKYNLSENTFLLMAFIFVVIIQIHNFLLVKDFGRLIKYA